MEKIDWTKPIEWVNSTGSVIKADFVETSPSGSRMIETPYGNIHCDEYGVLAGGAPGCVRNVANSEATDVELAVNIDEGFATLRDQFAMAALTGLLAHASGEDPRKAPAEAYKLADAMLEARNK